MLTSPLLLVTVAATLLFGGLTQPVDTGLTCPPQIEVPPEDAERAEAVVRRMVAAVNAATMPGADATTVATAVAAVDGLMVSFNPPVRSLEEIGYLGLPVPTDPNSPLTVGDPVELYGLAPINGGDQIALTVEVSNGSETRTVQFWLLREEGEWRVLGVILVALDPAGCYLPAPPKMVEGHGEVGVPPPVGIEDPIVVTGSPVAADEGELPPDAPPLGDPSGQFPAEPAGPIGLHVVNADGSALTNLTPHGGMPAWSPDGTRIAFSGFPAGPPEAGPEAGPDIGVMQADGSGQTAVTDGPGWDESPAWSPDGTRLAFLRVDWNAASSELYVVNADGSGLAKLADAAQPFPTPLFSAPPAWSPDGTKIAFAGPGESGSEVWVVGADGSDLRQLTDLPGDVAGPVWSPDGSQLAFADWVFGEMQVVSEALYVMNSDGTELMALAGRELPPGLELGAARPASPDPDATSVFGAPTWSPDGSHLAFASNWGLGMIGADGSDLVVHAVDDLHVTEPVWSPDGTQIAFSGFSFATELEQADIFLVDPDGSGLRQVAGTDWEDGGIAWSPDGSKLAFTAVMPTGE